MTGSGADTLTGSTADNQLSSGDGDDRLSGGGGRDTMIGGAGRDSMFGGDGDDSLDGGLGIDNLSGQAGNDTLQGGGGHDYIDGGTGSDTVVYGPDRWDRNTYGPELDPWHVEVNLIQGKARFTEPGYAPETLVSIENAITANGNDTLIGDESANRFEGGQGINVIQGNGGDDTLIGGYTSSARNVGWLDLIQPTGWHTAYGEFIDGGAGNDLIQSGGSNESAEDSRPNLLIGYEVMFGGSGDDTIVGGFGDVELTGGAGADRFVFSDEVIILNFEAEFAATQGENTITDFSRAQGDKIVVDLNVPSDDFDSRSPYAFRGGAADEAREWGWTRDGEDTVVTFNVVDAEEMFAYQPGLLTVTIRLADYSGPLAASDFEFV